jgi:hypothetical protein
MHEAGKPEERCSYLERTILAPFDVTIWRCALMEGPDGERYKESLAAGAGCCMPMFNEARRVLELKLFSRLVEGEGRCQRQSRSG